MTASALKDGPRVGPNAVIQLAAALDERCGAAVTDAVFTAGEVLAFRRDPPTEMIPQEIAIRAHRALYATLQADEAEAVAFEAGLRTGDYLLQHRIPKAAQWLLQRLPKPMAVDLLLAAIGKNAWTFAGSGRFTARREGSHVIINLFENPLATNPCAWHQGVFQRLFERLITARVRVEETQCCGAGASSCRFEFDV